MFLVNNQPEALSAHLYLKWTFLCPSHDFITCCGFVSAVCYHYHSHYCCYHYVVIISIWCCCQGFGVAAAPQAQGSLSLFGSSSQPMNGGAFGAQANPSGSLFGGSSFLTASGSSTTGTVVKFVPVTGTDVMMKGGTQQNVATKLQCITGMKEYECKSLEVCSYFNIT